MSKNDLGYLLDILTAAKLVKKFAKGVDRDRFENDELIQSGVIRQIELMGEAAKHVSDEFRSKYPEVPWKDMAGMRDILIHAYDHVDLDEVWNAIQFSVPEVIEKGERIFQEEENK